MPFPHFLRHHGVAPDRHPPWQSVSVPHRHPPPPGPVRCAVLRCAVQFPCQVLLGDLNTAGNGISRLSPNYCCDKMRFYTLGYSEGEIWARNIFGCMGGWVAT